MRILAILFAVVIVATPFVGCGASGSIGCVDRCGLCSDSEDCCGDRTCNTISTDADGRCQDFSFQCKLGS